MLNVVIYILINYLNFKYFFVSTKSRGDGWAASYRLDYCFLLHLKTVILVTAGTNGRITCGQCSNHYSGKNENPTHNKNLFITIMTIHLTRLNNPNRKMAADTNYRTV